MKKLVNGRYVELTEDEISEIENGRKEANYLARIAPRTEAEGIAEFLKTMLNERLEETEDKTLAIACMAFFGPWKAGVYAVGDVRTDPATGYPYECILGHNSTVNTDWTISERTLWKPYHSRKKEYALPWETPTGAHDMYKVGEYMIWTDYEIYKCISDTNYSPADYAAAWEKC